MAGEYRLEKFHGIVVPLLTPWRDGEVDLDVMLRHVERLASLGASGVFVNGSSGRCDNLSAATRRLVTEALFGFIRRKSLSLPLMIHVGSNDPELSLELTRHALPYADAIGCKSVRGFDARANLRHYTAVGEIAEGGLPLAIYHLASLGDTGVGAENIGELAAIPSLSGIKYTGSDLWVIRGIWESILEQTGRRLTVFSGEDRMFLSWMTQAAPYGFDPEQQIPLAGIGTTMNLLAGAYLAMIRAYKEGNLRLAIYYQARINQVVNLLAGYGSVSSWEAAMSLVGFEFGDPPPGSAPALTLPQKKELSTGLEAVHIHELLALNVPMAA